MSATVAKERSLLDRILDPFLDCLPPDVARRIAAVRADDETVELLDTLAEKNADGTITRAEREEYELLVTASSWVAVIQAKVRARAAG